MGNPLLGVLFHWLGGLASASFYVPFRKVRGWSWEIYWLIGGFFSWIFAPWIFAYFRTEDLFGVIAAADSNALMQCIVYGLLWGLGGLTFGLTMRYLGLSLGMAVALGLCAFFGTIIPPMLKGVFFTEVLPSTHGKIVLLGLALCLIGIAIVGLGGIHKEKESAPEERQQNIAEFDLKKGLLVALFCGLMSSCFAFGIAAGEPLAELSAAAGTNPLFKGLPVICIVLIGGATTNFLWCAYLIAKNKTAAEILQPKMRSANERPATSGINLLWCALAGVLWYFQFFFYVMGESQMGEYGFSSWTLHMASIIIFSSLWGFALKEWKGSSKTTLTYVFLGLGCLIGSTMVIGYGNSLV
jgi:L-rhamnose-H+ transport protein